MRPDPGLFDVPVDNVTRLRCCSRRVEAQLRDLLVVSPDVGGVVRARAMAKQLEADLAIIDKRARRPRRGGDERIGEAVEGLPCR